jgi:hypothetical protein
MMISLLHAQYLGKGEFAVGFSDGAQGTFDLVGYLRNRRGPLLQALQDEHYVDRAFVEAGALAWPNGLELSPERIYDNTDMARHAA